MHGILSFCTSCVHTGKRGSEQLEVCAMGRCLVWIGGQRSWWLTEDDTLSCHLHYGTIRDPVQKNDEGKPAKKCRILGPVSCLLVIVVNDPTHVTKKLLLSGVEYLDQKPLRMVCVWANKIRNLGSLRDFHDSYHNELGGVRP